MIAQKKRQARVRRHRRVRRRVSGEAVRPRLAIYRSNRHIYAQLIDDLAGKTLAAASSLDADAKAGEGGKRSSARAVGALIARRAKEAGIDQAVFDRGGFLFHGRVKELAEAAREEGLKL